MKILYLSIAMMLPVAAWGADLCAGATSGATITGVSYADGIVTASGTWRVGENAAGALVEYRIQSDRQSAETRSGASGSWEVALPYTSCDRNTFRVYVFPAFKKGDVLVHCTENGQSAAQSFMISCQPTAELGPCEWECSEGPPARCSGICAGTAKGGRGGLAGLQGINGEGFQAVEASAEGRWTLTVTCSPGDQVSFKVRDRSGLGAFSNVAQWPCGKN
jgi:hypothetical protein